MKSIKSIKAAAQKGFTLIELMITVAIVGILAAVALPAYQDYTIRAQVTEGVSLASGVKSIVAEFHANNGTFPTQNSDVDYTAQTGKYVSDISIADDATPAGFITITFGNDANANLQDAAQNKISLRAVEGAGGNLVWECRAGDATGATPVLAKYLPTSCK